MHACTCGQRFPGTLEGAFDAALHTEATGHRLRTTPFGAAAAGAHTTAPA